MRDEALQSSVVGAVQYNADLLNSLIARVNALEASATLVASETKAGLLKVEAFTVERDGMVRSELETAMKGLKVDFERLEATAQAAQPGVDFGRMGKAFDDLQSQVTAVTTQLSDPVENLQSQLTTAAARVEILEGASNLVHNESDGQFHGPWRHGCRASGSV